MVEAGWSGVGPVVEASLGEEWRKGRAHPFTVTVEPRLEVRPSHIADGLLVGWQRLHVSIVHSRPPSKPLLTILRKVDTKVALAEVNLLTNQGAVGPKVLQFRSLSSWRR